MIVLFLTGMVASTIVYKIRKDIAGDNELQKLELWFKEMSSAPLSSPRCSSVCFGWNRCSNRNGIFPLRDLRHSQTFSTP